MNMSYDIERQYVYFVNDVFITSISEITLEDYDFKRPCKQREKKAKFRELSSLE
jgi:hypothetical protein